MSAPADAPDWRKLTQEQLDLGFNNTLHVPQTASIVAEWDHLSEGMRTRYPQSLDLRYGPRERNRIDFLKAGDSAPTLVFIHGGYWQTRAKENFTFCAADAGARHQCRADRLHAGAGRHAGPDRQRSPSRNRLSSNRASALGGDPNKMILSGWSAGGHLSSMSLGHPHIKAGLLISGIYDLEPIRHSYLNAKLNLDDGVIQRNSPIRNPGGVNKPLVVVAGSGELPLLRKQSADYAGHRAAYGLPVVYEEIPGANHFTMMDELASPSGRLTTMIRQLFAQT